MWFNWLPRMLLLVSSIVVYGDYRIPSPKSWLINMKVPGYVKQHMTALPKGYDAMKLVRPARGMAKSGSLKITFHVPPKTSNELTMREHHLLVYLPHREKVSITNYTVHIKDLSSGRVIAHQILAIRKSDWFKIPLNISLDQKLELNAIDHTLIIWLHRDGEIFNFEEFFKSDTNLVQKLVPALLLHQKYRNPQKLSMFLGRTIRSGSKLQPTNPPRRKRSTGNTSCSFTIHNMYLNWTGALGTLLYPNNFHNFTTKVCERSVNVCCVPRVTEDFPILYMDNQGDTRMRTIRDVIVHECACPRLSAIDIYFKKLFYPLRNSTKS